MDDVCDVSGEIEGDKDASGIECDVFETDLDDLAARLDEDIGNSVKLSRTDASS